MKSGLLFCAPLLLALVVGCVISPRRTVSNNGFPSPSPTISPGGTPSPTPFPTVTVTPTPTATPTPTPAAAMSVIVTAVPGEPMLNASKTHPDGSTSPVPGSPFLIAEAPRKLMALGSNLLVESENSISVFAVDEASGTLKQTGLLPAPMLRDAVVNSSDSTVYLLDQTAVSAFRVQNDRMIALAGSPYPLTANEAAQPDPRMLALDSSGESLLVSFASIQKDRPESFLMLKRAPDGSLGSPAAVSSVPEEVHRAFSAETASAPKARIATVIKLQASQ